MYIFHYIVCIMKYKGVIYILENTLVLIKPDAVERNLANEIIRIYESNKLKVKQLKLVHATKDMAIQHYLEHKGQPFFDDLISYITRSPLIALILEGENAIKKVREINGSSNPQERLEGTIRYLYSSNNQTENCVHASDSNTSATREINIWFNNKE